MKEPAWNSGSFHYKVTIACQYKSTLTDQTTASYCAVLSRWTFKRQVNYRSAFGGVMSVHPSRKNFRAFLLCMAAALCFFALLAPVTGAQSLPLYGVSASDNGNNNLTSLDPVTGNVLSTVLMTLSGKNLNGGNGLAQNPVNGKLFVLLSVNGQTGRELG